MRSEVGTGEKKSQIGNVKTRHNRFLFQMNFMWQRTSCKKLLRGLIIFSSVCLLSKWILDSSSNLLYLNSTFTKSYIAFITFIRLNYSPESLSDARIGKADSLDLDFIHTITSVKRIKNSEYTYVTNLKAYLPCSEKKLAGPLFTDMSSTTLFSLVSTLKFVKYGGWWAPADCNPQHHVAIVIPFRKREDHLPILLRQLLPILERRRYHFRIFVVEQYDNYTFNKGKLLNVGFVELQKIFPFDCIVFHDVDLVPEDDRIEYGCESSPTHVSVAINNFMYELPNDQMFGGVVMLLREHFLKINGFSNSFWLWGGEDDNLSVRVQKNNMSIHRQPLEIARFKMIAHTPSKDAQKQTVAHRYMYVREANQYIKEDGLNTLQYEVVTVKEARFYTLIQVDLQKNRDRRFGVFDYFLD